MVASLIGTKPFPSPRICPATEMTPLERRGLALEVLHRQRTVEQMAAERGVSRKFAYQQVHKARQALAEAFSGEQEDPKVLYWIPVTRDWIGQFVLGLLLVGHCSERGVIELAGSLLDYRDLSLGGIHNIMRDAAARAGQINEHEDLSGIAVAAFDEIYQAGCPVLGAVDVVSTYCPLLSIEEHCDVTTWGVRLLELSEKRGLRLRGSVADGGQAFRVAQAQVWPGVPCQGDVFHPLRDMQELVGFLRDRAEATASVVHKLQHQREVLERDGRRSLTWARRRVTAQLAAARSEHGRAAGLSADVQVLTGWMRQDVLSVAGGSWQDRQMNWEFILGELEARGALCPQRLPRLCRGLRQQREQLLLFAAAQERQMLEAAECLGVAAYQVQEMARLQAMDPNQAVYWQRHGQLARKLGQQFGPVQQAVQQILQDSCRASSLVENLNGRLRCCFFLRRQLSQRYLDLLRFYFNHHRLERSRCPHRAGQTPWQVLSGRAHPHWLEMLGHRLFHRN